ncbi:hypothetical protein VULLAG_LOCUS13283 [Vulpes lagopus]
MASCEEEEQNIPSSILVVAMIEKMIQEMQSSLIMLPSQMGIIENSLRNVSWGKGKRKRRMKE